MSGATDLERRELCALHRLADRYQLSGDQETIFSREPLVERKSV